MTIINTRQRKQRDPIVSLLLNGGRVTSGFRAALFAAASRAGISVNEFVLQAAAEKLRASGSQFSGVFEPGDLLENLNDNRQDVSTHG
ncbi:hypothetical protein IE4872_CH01608 [Rhizobium gallicum]|uniref:Ribbon-helix-helix domain-containing protein n=1 Tax=Rhizobium gallicum TaxID=56730 RepID=A0A1L5NH87_9HYPH|nr:hypothetical protein [Rhizobium gallicum]APO67250.1 hypothetical protein IE4872_CH01608 [Rhizobium gallicum]